MHTAILIGGFSCLDTMKLTQPRRASIKREPNGRQTVTTEAFVSQLALINFHWSCRQANQWIETYVTVFKDISTQEGENRTFMLFNPQRRPLKMGFPSPATDYPGKTGCHSISTVIQERREYSFFEVIPTLSGKG